MPLKSWIIPRQTGRDINFIKDVGLIGRYDRNTQDGTETGRKYEKPDQWPYQSSNESASLLYKPQTFAPDDAGKSR